MFAQPKLSQHIKIILDKQVNITDIFSLSVWIRFVDFLSSIEGQTESPLFKIFAWCFETVPTMHYTALEVHS